MHGLQLKYSDDSAMTLEPVVKNGKLVTGDILRQNQALILCLHKGELKEYPAVGAGISDMLLDNNPLYWRTVIKEQLEMDGQKVESVRVNIDGIDIEADY